MVKKYDIKCDNCKRNNPFLKDKCSIHAKAKSKSTGFMDEAYRTFCDEDKSSIGCDYICKYIEYPITIEDLKTEKLNYNDNNKIGNLAKIMFCEDNKTYLGLYLGDLPLSIDVSVSDEKLMTIEPSMNNPAFLVPELNKIVFGCESFWSFIEKEEDLKDITEDDIANVWYVRLLKKMSEGK